eukprot:1159543-Pelagomonas_calceolata.AAC.3
MGMLIIPEHGPPGAIIKQFFPMGLTRADNGPNGHAYNPSIWPPWCKYQAYGINIQIVHVIDTGKLRMCEPNCYCSRHVLPPPPHSPLILPDYPGKGYLTSPLHYNSQVNADYGNLTS